jgi:hypothetical protein
MGSGWRIALGFMVIFMFTMIFGVFLDGFANVINWTSGGSTLADFTGMEAMVQFTPFILWLLGIGVGGWLAFSGIQGVRHGKGGGNGGGMH